MSDSEKWLSIRRLHHHAREVANSEKVTPAKTRTSPRLQEKVAQSSQDALVRKLQAECTMESSLYKGRKRSSSSNLLEPADMERKRSSSTSNDRSRAVVAGVRSNLLQFFDQDDKIVREGVRMAKDMPTAVWFDVDENIKAISATFPEFDHKLVFNIAASLTKTGQDQTGVMGQRWGSELDSSKLAYKLSHSYQTKGICAKASKIDVTLYKQIDSSQARELWGGDSSWTSCLQLKCIEDAMKTLQPLISKSRQCIFDYEVVAKKRSVVGTLKLDVIIKLKGHPATEHASAGAILSLHSGGASSCFDNDYSVGQLVTYGQEFLNRCPERLSVVLGITDLNQICWFRLSRCGPDDADVALGGFNISRSGNTPLVRESLGGYLLAEPASLGLAIEWEANLPVGWTIKGYLGSGKTSNVYEVHCPDGKRCALKVLKSGYEGHDDDVKYLQQLQGIDGVPTFLKSIHNSMLVMQPVGDAFEADAIGQPDLPLASLVDVLEQAHRLNIVNRDVRQENMIVAESLHTKKRRLFIYDWGFAENIDCKCGSFRGSIQTASDSVLQQSIEGSEYLKYTPADDLISLVRCIFLVLNPVVATELYNLGHDAEAVLKFWLDCDSKHLWKKAHDAAAQTQYKTLKEVFGEIEELSRLIGK